MNSSAESSALTRRPVLGALGALAAASLGGTAGCMSWPEPTVPMRVRHIAARCAPQRRVVLLPGVRSLADDFVHEGFVAQLQRAAPACEVLLADAHLGYFVEGQLLRRLRDDVLRPAVVPAGGGRTAANDATNSATSSATHRAALERPWLVGVSLGGLMALAYAMRHGDELAGVLAIAPYLGQRTLLRDISAAGGPLAWSRRPPPAHLEPHEATEHALWRWFASPGFGTAHPTVHLAFGRNDRFGDALRVLQSLLPADHTDVIDGRHTWAPWRVLWQRWLDRGLLAAPALGCGPTQL
ncbi:MAG: hypothetical protein IPM15_18250 [Betaproteobacteria bacterium]|nr:hypothetical protein [Betaproteobacteria bacterium]